MSDLVAKLRDAFQRKRYGNTPGDYDPDFDLFDVAADEIERLRAEHDNMLAVAGKVSFGPSYADIAKDARHDMPVTDAPRDD
jgi:hypothetical protein